jgi:glycerol-3-phosphate dehydrogenase
VVLSGPSHAEEVAVHDITTITAASENLADAVYVQELFMLLESLPLSLLKSAYVYLVRALYLHE